MNTRVRAVPVVKVGIVFVAFISTFAASCQKQLQLSPSAFVQALKSDGWTYSDPPRGILGAGSIVSVAKTSGVTYRSTLATCISDPDVTKVTESAVALSGTLSGGSSFDINALVGFQKFSAGPDFNIVKSFSLKLGKTTEQAIDSIKVSDWINKNRGSLSAGCADALVGKPGEAQDPTGGIYVLTDVLKVVGYTYTFNDATGAKVTLTQGNINKYITLSGGVDYKANATGDLEVTSDPLYIAFKSDVSTKVGAAGAAPSPTAVDIANAHNAAAFGSR
jgi:hypothetical protein